MIRFILDCILGVLAGMGLVILLQIIAELVNA